MSRSLYCSKKRQQQLKKSPDTWRDTRCYSHIPAQVSEGLEIQLLQLLLAEPVADPTALQEGLHLEPRSRSHSEGG